MAAETLFDFEQPLIDLELKLRDLQIRKSNGGQVSESELEKLQKTYDQERERIYKNLTPWQRVQLARHPKRPYLADYIPKIFADFMELHGDRMYADDAAILAGLAFLDDTSVMVIGHRKGRTLQESLERNFGMPHPEGYRKALRLMKLAEQFNLPILCFVDTSGAYPGIGAEERGQAEAIARNLREMSNLKVPVIVTVLGEGGSGGALAIGVGDSILMLENAWYSVISPEGCAAILFHDAAKAQVAASALKITAVDLFNLHIIDEIVPEPLGGAQKDVDLTAGQLKKILIRHLKSHMAKSPEELTQSRYQKFRTMGLWFENQPTAKPAAKKKGSKKAENKL